MDDLSKEIIELKEFIAELKSDRAAAKDKEKREAWTKYTSMSIVVIAVLAAIATQQGGKCSSTTLVELNKSTFNQAKASDKWSQYQANSIKQNLYETIHDVVPKEGNGTPAQVAEREERFKAKIKKYTDTKETTFKEATALEALRDQARETADKSSRRGGGLGLSVSIFQISIAMGSICLVTKKKWLWYLSLGLAGLATWKLLQVMMDWPAWLF